MINNRPVTTFNKNGKVKHHQGLYIPQNKDKVLKLNNNGGVYYRSGWEKKMNIWLDLKPEIITWGAEFIEIPYKLTKFKDGIPEVSSHRYFPDYFYKIQNDDGSTKQVVAEVKPYKETVKPIAPTTMTKKQLQNFEYDVLMWNKNLSKWQTAIEWCKMKGFEFIIITEEYINNLK